MVFLDTTAFADHLFGGLARRRAIDEIIEGNAVVSSRYVREQFRATFLRAAVLAYNTLVDSGDPLEVIRLTDEYDFFTRGEGAKARKVVVTILQEETTDTSDKLIHLARLIEIDMMRKFDSLANIKDDTRCCQCPNEPEKDKNEVYHFKKKCTLEHPQPCQIEAFWGERYKELSGVANSTERNVENARIAAAEVIAGELPRGRRCFVHLSDAVIIAESDANSVLVTSNMRDFAPLTEAIGGNRSVVTYLAKRPCRPG